MRSGQSSIVLVLILLVLALAAICAASGAAVITDENGAVFVGKPEVFAEATAIAKAGDMAREATREALSFEATVNAASGQATATSAAVQALATATAVAQMAQATQTAIPYQAAIAQSEAQTQVLNAWAVTLLGVIGGGIAALSIAFAVAAWVRTKSRVAWVGANGPVLVVGNTVIDVGKAIGPAISLPGQDPLVEIARIAHLLKTGEAQSALRPPPQLSDGGATADHYLAAAQAAAHTNAMGAMFRPDNAERGRQEKLDRLEKRGQPAQPAGPVLLPRIRVIDDPKKVEDFGRLLEASGE